jgi:hypothetical protein
MMPDHPRANKGGYVPEHVLVVENAMGKPLRSGAIPHHANGDPADNRNENLVACHNQAHHMLIHARARIVRAGGRPSLHKICCGCDTLLLKKHFYPNPTTWDGVTSLCRECQRIRNLDRKRHPRQPKEVSA